MIDLKKNHRRGMERADLALAARQRGDAASAFLAAGERGQQQGGENRYDGHDHQQLDERERRPIAQSSPALIPAILHTAYNLPTLYFCKWLDPASAWPVGKSRAAANFPMKCVCQRVVSV